MIDRQIIGWVCYIIGITQIMLGDIFNHFIVNNWVQLALSLVFAIIGTIGVRCTLNYFIIIKPVKETMKEELRKCLK